MPPTPTLVTLSESVSLVEAAAGSPSGRFRARLIEADVWGTSGYYGRSVLEETVTANVFGDGLPIYLDHPTLSERIDRPVRSVRDLAGKLVGDAVMEADGIYSDIQVYPHVAPLIEAMRDDIGMSIRAGGQVEQGEAGGQSGAIVTSIDEAQSVDFVTAPGAGGRVVSSLQESARANLRVIERGVFEESTVNDRREALSTLLKDAHGGDKIYVWLKDFDETYAWFEVEDGSDTGCYQQAYTSGDDDLPNALTGERVEVRVSTQYVPVTPAGQSTTEESEEDTMPQIEEARLRELEEAAGRVSTLESERDEAQTERDTARRELAEATARSIAADRARTRVTEANSDLAPPVVDRIVTDALREVPLTEQHQLDETAFDTRVDEARTAEETYLASLEEAAGAGTVRGFGSKSKSTSSEEDEKALDEARGRAFGRKGA